MPIKIKKNIFKLKASSTLAINERSKELIKDGKKIFRFGFGQSPFQIPEKIVEGLKNNAHKKEYLPIQGLPDLRDKISKYLFERIGVKYSKENILITPGSKEAMLLLHVTFNGEILTPAPSWVSYQPQAEIGKNKVHWLETSRENNWFPTAKELENKLQIENQTGTICSLDIPKGAMLLANNNQKVYCNQVVAEIKKDANLILEEDRKDIYTEVAGEVFLQNIDLEESIDGEGATKKISKNAAPIF